jgi:pyridoxamine 5'-phosphate oxidase
MIRFVGAPDGPDLAAMRRDYAASAFDEGDLAPTWLEQFSHWLEEAVEKVAEPNAMIVATADAAARPSARTILLKAVDEAGFVFFTNLESRKGRELAENPRAALVFPWLDVRRQVIVEGQVQRVADEESDSYFATRPRGAQVGAVASPQSAVLHGRDQLDALRARAEESHPGGEPIARPAHWGGLRVVPESVEFWQGRADRLHDRLRYRREGDREWVVERLAP